MTSSGARIGLLAALATLTAGDALAQYGYTPSRDYYRNDTAEGTVTGGVLGAIAGAIIGDNNGKSGEGALIGAGVGALTGNLMGRNKDAADQRQAAYGMATANQANQRAAALAVTNYDLIQMTQAGLGETVILGAIQQRGARLDLSPQGLIDMKRSGVSDRVIVAAQQSATSAGTVAPPVVQAQPQPQTVIIEQPPVIYHHYRPRPSVVFTIGGHPRHHHHGPRW